MLLLVGCINIAAATNALKGCSKRAVILDESSDEYWEDDPVENGH